MTTPAGSSLAACRNYFVASTTHLATLDAQQRTQHRADSGGTGTVETPEDLLPQAIGWTLHEHGPRYFDSQLGGRHAAALTGTLRTLAGTPPTGCCADPHRNGNCYDCEGLVASARSDEPALLFDFALVVLGWPTPGDASGPEW
jgi:hypothetical protein